ncbi:hypothetical protein ACLQ25_00045 [Micromonospora sp. DT44]|uniref:hypothetical protein n=1 Tax=Micromonospora sp. DT44 TaxID=3393439 RepID=UPI003CEFCF5A
MDGATDDDLRSAYERALTARREQQRGWGVVRSNLNMRVEWNRRQSQRIRVTGAQWYAPLPSV